LATANLSGTSIFYRNVAVGPRTWKSRVAGGERNSLMAKDDFGPAGMGAGRPRLQLPEKVIKYKTLIVGRRERRDHVAVQKNSLSY
jgi:hypothetical protein